MLTKNYRRLVNQMALSVSGGQAQVKSITDTSYTVTGSVIYTFLGSNFAAYTKANLLNTTGNGSTFVFGTSDQAESADDLYLVAECDDTLFTRDSATKTIINSSLDNNITLSQNVTYNGTDPVEIKEVAILCSTTNSTTGFIWCRQVLEAPISLTQGQSFTFALKIGD